MTVQLLGTRVKTVETSTLINGENVQDSGVVQTFRENSRHLLFLRRVMRDLQCKVEVTKEKPLHKYKETREVVLTIRSPCRTTRRGENTRCL